jgi:hypothetical protein
MYWQITIDQKSDKSFIPRMHKSIAGTELGKPSHRNFITEAKKKHGLFLD